MNVIFCSIRRNEATDLHPNEPDSAPPITGPIHGPTYFEVRKDCIMHNQVFQLTIAPSVNSPKKPARSSRLDISPTTPAPTDIQQRNDVTNGKILPIAMVLADPAACRHRRTINNQ